MSAFRAFRVVVRLFTSFNRDHRRQLAVAPCVAEVLERRQILTVGPTVEAVLSGNEFVIDGTKMDDDIRVQWLRNDASTNQLNVTVGGQFVDSFAATGVQRIVAKTYQGNDTFPNGTALPSVIYGGSGNDTLIGGSDRDKIFGEGGSDILKGREWGRPSGRRSRQRHPLRRCG
ncbi:MAG: hypothetical protein KDA93_27985 [Planctomycetaceae bacterium]|nr:hypothetical protein [Planctomycetaceae bacterium]